MDAAGREAAAAGGGEGDRDAVRDRAQRDAGRDPGPRDRGGGCAARRLPAAGPRGGVPRAVDEDEDLLRDGGEHMGRGLLREGGRRRARERGDAGRDAGAASGEAAGVHRVHEVGAGAGAEGREVPRAGVLEVRGGGEQVLPARDGADIRDLAGPGDVHRREPAAAAPVRERGRVAGRVDHRAGRGSHRRPEHVLRDAAGLRVEGAGGERVRGVVRLDVQRDLQVGGEAEGRASKMRGGRRRGVEHHIHVERAHWRGGGEAAAL